MEDKLIELLWEIDSNDKEAIILIVSYGRQKGCTKEIIKFIERNKKANFEDIVAFCYCYGKIKLPND